MYQQEWMSIHKLQMITKCDIKIYVALYVI